MHKWRCTDCGYEWEAEPFWTDTPEKMLEVFHNSPRIGFPPVCPKAYTEDDHVGVPFSSGVHVDA